MWIKNDFLPDIQKKSFLISIIILSQIRSSITWTFNYYLVFSGVILLFYYIVLKKKQIYNVSVLSGYSLIFFLAVFVFLNFKVSSLISFFCYMAVLIMPNEDKRKALKYLTNSLSFIVFISLLGWSLHNLNIIEFPVFRILDLAAAGNVGILEDHLLFVHNPNLAVPRFYSIFEEPSHLALLLSFVLYANRFNLNDKKILVIFIGLIFTYSLTGYIISMFGYLLLNIRNRKQIFIFLFFIFFIFGLVLKNVEEFDRLILNRVINFGDSLSERNSDELQSFFDYYISSFNVFLGMGEGYSYENFTGESYKTFIINYGIVGLISLFLLYLSISIRFKFNGILTFLLYIAAFIPFGGSLVPWQILLFSISCYTIDD